MAGIITFLGVLLALGGIAIFIVNKVKETNILGKRGWILTLVLGLFIVFLGNSLVHVKGGQVYVVYSPFGGKTVHSTTGLKFVMVGSQIQKWDKIIDIKTVPIDENGNFTQPTEGIEGIIRGGIPIRFIDQVTGEVYVSVRMELPETPNEIIQLVEDFRHPSNLINNTLIPTVREQIINTGYMYAAQDYISGAASDFRLSIDDQLNNGGLSVEKKEIFDTIYSDIQIEGDRQIKEINTRYDVEIRTKDGKPIRIPHDVNKNGVFVAQVIVDNVELESAFRKRLEKQRDIASQKRVEMEAIELAKISQQKIIAEGERDKADERVQQEKAQVSELIAIETQKKKEVTKKELAEIALKTAKLEAQTRKVLADAKQYELQRADGLSEEAKYRIDKAVEEKIGVAKALAGDNGLKLPQYYLTGGDKGNSSQSDLITMLLMKMVEGNGNK